MSLAFDAPEPTDGEILRRVRAGDPAAYGQLYQRHLGVARRLARSVVCSPADADDIVAEVFAATFAAIRRGAGPHEDFLPYVLRSIRRECRRSWRRGSRDTALADVAERTAGPDDDFARRDERDLLAQAFVALPARMQAVLWHIEVDGLSHAEIARQTRSTPQAIAQLAVRARRSLGDRYLQAHMTGTTKAALPAGCAATRASLAEVVRGTASARRQRAVTEHLAECPACAEAHDHLHVVNERLRGLTMLAVAATVVAPKRWAAGVAVRAGAWLLGSTAPLTAAVALVVIATVAPPAVPAASSPSITVDTAVVVDAAPPPILPEARTQAAGSEQTATEPAVPSLPETPQPATPEPIVPATTVPSATAPVTTPPAPAREAAGSPITVPLLPPPLLDAVAPDVDIEVTLDVPPVRLPSLPPLPLVDQLSDTLDLEPIELDVGVGDAVEGRVGVGDAAVDASISGDGVAIDVGGSVDVPLLDVPPVVLPPIGLPLFGG